MSEYTRENTSPKYRELLGYYKLLHTEGDAASGSNAGETFDGRSIVPHIETIRHLLMRNEATTLLDYGCGKAQGYDKATYTTPEGEQLKGLKAIWGVQSITLYDPAYAPYSRIPEGTFDAVICSDVLEHIPTDDIDWLLGELFSYAEKTVFVTAALYKAAKQLPNGENAHVTIKPMGWWVDKMEQAHRDHAGINYCLVGIEIDQRQIHVYG